MHRLESIPGYTPPEGPVLCIVLDGYGIGKHDAGDCVHIAQPEHINRITEEAKKKSLYCELKAHGTAVGLPDDTDMGNSEVGHNALGAGQLIDQGSKLVGNVIADGSMFQSTNFKFIVEKAKSGATVHLFGLLSDGNVHSSINYVVSIVAALQNAQVPKVRFHILTDGRDVPSMSSLSYVDTLEAALASTCLDYKIASGGGRMYVTMDRYESDWKIVKRGWDAMVHGTLDLSVVPECAAGWTGKFLSCTEAIESARSMFPKKTDQDYPPFVISDSNGEPLGRVQDGDVVINFNFRGDRAIQITKAFEDNHFTFFSRGYVPKIDYFGLLIYDNDKGIPRRSLCPNPDIKNVMSQDLAASNVTQYAVSETHKFGHVTYFWNGNKSGYVAPSLELYEEVKSEPNEMIPENPAMKAIEISDRVSVALAGKTWKFLRVNFANGDMVGHTGLIPETVAAVRILDAVVGRLVEEVSALNGVTIITADHGNCEEKLDEKGKMKTSHTLNKVPFIVVDPRAPQYVIDLAQIETPGLTNVAATILNILGFKAPKGYRETLIRMV